MKDPELKARERQYRVKLRTIPWEWQYFRLLYSEAFCAELDRAIIETIGESISIMDCTGKMMFLGDLIGGKCTPPEKGKLVEIVFREGAFMKKFAPDEKDGIIDYAYFNSKLDPQCYRIYGNIHDNPELL